MSTNILQLATEGRAQDIVRDMRVRSLYSNYYFTKVVLDYPRLTDYFHQIEMESFLTRWSEGQTKQAIEWSRGFYKTTCFTIGTSMWVPLPYTQNDSDYAIYHLGIPEDEWFQRVKLHNQNVRQLLAFETNDNSLKKIGEISWHFKENALFRTLFPEIAWNDTEGRWTQDCLIIRRTGEGNRHFEGTFEAIGVGGSLQSRHYDIIWEDDLVGKAAVESESVMEKTIRWHGLLHGCFVDATRQVRFLVSNRWGYHDLNSHIRANEPDFLFHTRSAIQLSQETGQDEPLFPYDGLGDERFTVEALSKIQNMGSMTKYDFSCQYMNSPCLPTENEISLSNIHRYKVSADGQLVCACGAKWYPEQLLITMHYDAYNAKGVNSKSCPCITIIGCSPDEHVFLLDFWMVRGVYEAVYNKLYSYNDQWRPYKFTYEDVGHQNMTEFHIREVEKNPIHTKAHRKFPQIIPVKTGNRDKSLRIRDHFLPYIERGCFAARESHKTFFTMLETFPNVVLDHDYDLLDCLAQGATIWKFPLDDERREKELVDEQKFISELGKPYSYV